MYFPIEKHDPFQCPKCKQWFGVRPGPRISCAVMHAPGDCCHYGEEQVEAPPLAPEPSGNELPS
jgi:hypothetical protein